MNCIVVDDEPLARDGMENLITAHGELSLSGCFNNALKASEFLRNNEIDLIFLDIEMPGITGLEFARHIPKETLVIFITAYKEYAFDSYMLDAIDYLLKPVFPQQFEKAVDKAIQFHGLLKEPRPEIDRITKDYILVKSERKYHKISLDRIQYIEGLKDYVILHLPSERVIAPMNLKTIHEKLPKDRFFRISKSYIVNEIAIESFDTQNVYLKDLHLPIGKVYLDDFFRKFLGRP